MNTSIRAALACLTSLIVQTSTAQESCSPVSTVVYFGNGVGTGAVTTFADATSAKFRLNALVNGVLPDPDQDLYSFKLAFNESPGTMTDIIEAARQTFGNGWPTILLAFVMMDTRLLALVPDSAKQKFNDFLTNRAIQKLVAPDLANTNLSTQLESYEGDINEGKKIVLVSHSQGNIFGNLAYQQLKPASQQYFAMVPVASPEPLARRSLVGHVRFYDDVIIGGVQIARALVGLPAPLPATTEDEIDKDWLSHYFVESYLANVSSRNFIVDGILRSAQLLPSPPANAGQGAVTVTLTWGANPDVDLHAFEPLGTHVYYGSMAGQMGSLDVDNTIGFGPEHYVVTCQRLRDNTAGVGRYRFGVNYFAGSTPEVAKLTVKTPTTERTFTKALPVAVGPNGDNSPQPVADVVVSKDPSTGVFNFSIEER